MIYLNNIANIIVIHRYLNSQKRALLAARLMKVRYNVTVPAVSEEALPGILKKLGLYDDASGKAACYVCGAPLTLNTIGAIAKLDGKAVLICDSPPASAKPRCSPAGRRRAAQPLRPSPCAGGSSYR